MSGVARVAVLAAVGVGGLLLAIGGWLQPSPSLARTVAHLRRAGAAASRSGDADGRVLRSLVRAVAAHPRFLPSEQQLRVLGRTTARHVLWLALAVAAGFVAPGIVLAVLQRAGLLGLGWVVPLVGALAGAVLAPLLVHTAAVEAAARVRADLRYQTSAYLDVVTMLLAGNTGYERALDEASRAGAGRLFVELRRRVRETGARGASLTEALRRTGAELGIDELEQVAATAALSASEGAPVARSLTAKCATLRGALATEQESEARLRTSRLTTPIVGMALIFMGLVIYPALSFS